MKVDKRIATIAKNSTHLNHGEFDKMEAVLTSGEPDLLDYFSRLQILTGQHLMHEGLSRQYFLRLFDTGTDMLFVLVPGGRIAEVNHRALLRLNVLETALEGTAFTDMLSAGSEVLSQLSALVERGDKGWDGRPLLSLHTGLMDSRGGRVAVHMRVYRLPEGWGRHHELLVICRETGLAALREWVRVAVEGAEEGADRAKMLAAIQAMEPRPFNNPAIRELGLSFEDLQLLKLLGQGLTAEKIGEMIGKDKRAVDRHREKLFKKRFKVKTFEEMLVEAVQRRLIGRDAYWDERLG